MRRCVASHFGRFLGFASLHAVTRPSHPREIDPQFHPARLGFDHCLTDQLTEPGLVGEGS